jgi:hypothetical protein
VAAVVEVVMTVLVVTVLAGCSVLARSQAGPVRDPADDPAAVACVVGRWSQVEGWQRLTVADAPLELTLVTGGAGLTLAADGSATIDYGAGGRGGGAESQGGAGGQAGGDGGRVSGPTVWRGANSDARLEVAYRGVGSLTYTARGGAWSQVADLSGVVGTVTLDGARDERAGAVDEVTTGTFSCTDARLVIRTPGTRYAYQRG